MSRICQPASNAEAARFTCRKSSVRAIHSGWVFAAYSSTWDAEVDGGADTVRVEGLDLVTKQVEAGFEVRVPFRRPVR